MKRKVVLAFVVVLIVVGALGATKMLQFKAMGEAGAGFSIPPETISTATADKLRWETVLPAVGTVTAAQGVTLKSELSGTVKSIEFQSGQAVRAGQPLVLLDSSQEQAQLRAAEARAELAQANVNRLRDLRHQDLVAQSDLDNAEAQFKSTRADVEALKVTIEKKSIRAPFGGRVGIRLVQLGQFLDVGTAIVTLQSLDTVHVDFSLPEQSAGSVKPGMLVRISADAVAGRAFEGKLTAVDPEVDAATRNLRLQATLSNKDGALLPGMFVRAALILPEARDLVAVPVTAVLNAPYGDSVFVIEDVKDEKTGKSDKRALMTTVKLGETRGDMVEVLTGLQAGKQVASSGVFKLHNQALVTINNELAPRAEESPKPADS